MNNKENYHGMAGAVAVVLWLLIFLLGLTIDSQVYRREINPQPSRNPVDIAFVTFSFDSVKQRMVVQLDSLPAAPTTEKGEAGEPPKKSKLEVFGMTFMTFTVTNVAILCCLAGIIGVAARNYSIIKKRERLVRLKSEWREISPATEEATEKAMMLKKEEEEDIEEELVHPVYVGLIRGFLVFVLFLAGVYVATSDPFNSPTASQYGRLAGTVSLLSFLLSYDTKFLQSILGAASNRFRGVGKK